MNWKNKILSTLLLFFALGNFCMADGFHGDMDRHLEQNFDHGHERVECCSSQLDCCEDEDVILKVRDNDFEDSVISVSDFDAVLLSFGVADSLYPRSFKRFDEEALFRHRLLLKSVVRLE